MMTPPLRETQSSWKIRSTNPKRELLRRYYLIFEGTKTEVRYFNGVVRFQRDLNIPNIVEIIPLQKEEDISGHSTPPQLLELANDYRTQKKKVNEFNNEVDQIIIILDLDFFEKEKQYLDYLEEVEHCDHRLVVTNPCFEVWLLLHYLKAESIFFQEIFSDIMNKALDLKSEFSKKSGMNSNNVKFVKMKDKIDFAIKQEKFMNQDNKLAFGKISSNVGRLIISMRENASSLL